jgi:hypothetical protein
MGRCSCRLTKSYLFINRDVLWLFMGVKLLFEVTGQCDVVGCAGRQDLAGGAEWSRNKQAAATSISGLSR